MNTGNIDLSLVISILALFSTVLSPIITSVISGRYRIKEKELDLNAAQAESSQRFYIEHRALVIENYIKSVGNAIQSRDFTDFGFSMAEIYLYTSPELWPMIDKLTEYLEAYRYEEASKALIELSKKLSSENIRN